MQYRHLFPMVRILLPFMAGIIVCIVVAGTSIISLSIWIGLTLLTISSALIPKLNRKIKTRILFGIFLSLFLFTSGYNSVIFHKEILRPNHFSHLNNEGVLIAHVIEPLQEKSHSFKTILEVCAYQKGKTNFKAEGRILTYFAKDTLVVMPEEGSLIAISAKPQEISPPANPGAFDYRKYMAANNVYHQVYLKSRAWKILQPPIGFNIYRTAHKVSKKFVSILNENGLKGREFAVASALIMGQSNMLDSETLQAYSGTGVMHILSVSGLHVGVIFIIINFLLSFIKNKGRLYYLKTIIILLTIWAYALLTGMSPSVMRSAAMFTFISLGNLSSRYVHIINSLATSALFLLLIDPLIINNIGFQLSYIAILGIVFINKPIADLWEPTNKIVTYIWELIAVSIAAQIATAPLAMFYFHQFPSYFIPANLVAIPLSFLAIYSGVAVLATSFIPVVSNFLGLITNYLLFAMNTVVGFIERLPHSALHITWIFTTETILIYLIIVAILLLFYFKRKELVFVILSGILLLAVSFSITQINRTKQHKIIFYSANKQSAIGLIKGKKQVLVTDSALLNNETAGKFLFDGTRTLFGFTDSDTLTIEQPPEFIALKNKSLNYVSSFGYYFFFEGKRILLLTAKPEYIREIEILQVDYLVISQNPKMHIKDLLRIYKPSHIIFDGSNSYYKTTQWLDECKTAGLDAYSIKNSGARLINL